MKASSLYWLPEPDDWSAALLHIRQKLDAAALISLANHRFSLARLEQLDALASQLSEALASSPKIVRTVRLAILSSSTTSHLHAAIRIAGLRNGLLIEIYEPGYQQYVSELLDRSSELFRFRPDVVLFSFDARFAVRNAVGTNSDADVGSSVGSAVAAFQHNWTCAREGLGCAVLQQTIMPLFLDQVGQNEQLSPNSPANLTRAMNGELRRAAAATNISLLAVDRFVERDGLDTWFAGPYWFRAKQEVAPSALQLYGDLVGRLLAAMYGRSAKCLCLDLDNTLWGGVIGDDGLAGIVLGQGSAEGEAFVEFQTYVKALAERGIILAICSKNDERNALEVFERHPEMVLKRDDIACFVANWDDKATNIRRIAKTLNIGLDAIVFVDDNPFEREQVRRDLANVIVPELPDDPSRYARCLCDAGYFESIAITADDRARMAQYRSNEQRIASIEAIGDYSAYLASLDMKVCWGTFDPVAIGRVTQLINKTNQFNLTTRRYTQDEVEKFAADPATICIQMRVTDRFGDNGIVAIVIAHVEENVVCVDTWLMSCRVIGRRIEEATLVLLVREARRFNSDRIEAHYRATEKNGMVERLLPTLGFVPCTERRDEHQWFGLDLSTYVEPDLPISFAEVEAV